MNILLILPGIKFVMWKSCSVHKHLVHSILVHVAVTHDACYGRPLLLPGYRWVFKDHLC